MPAATPNAKSRGQSRSRNSQTKSAGRKTTAADKRHDERIDMLLKTELSFIPHSAFRRPSQLYPDGPTTFVADVEDGRVAPPKSTTDGLPSHLARMCATPLLKPEQEQQLFERMNFCKYKANALRARLGRDPELADELEAFIEKAERIRNYLIQANTRLVMSIARKFADARNHFDDLLSQGIASLMHSVEKFDFSRGYRFSTYATCAVRRDLYRLVMKRKKDLNRFNTGAAEHLSETADERDVPSPSAEADWRHLSSSLESMLEVLDDREQMIIVKRFGLDTLEGKKASYSKLGKSLGISKERVRQLANRAMDKLREGAEQHNLHRLLA